GGAGRAVALAEEPPTPGAGPEHREQRWRDRSGLDARRIAAADRSGRRNGPPAADLLDRLRLRMPRVIGCVRDRSAHTRLVSLARLADPNQAVRLRPRQRLQQDPLRAP